MAAEQLVPFPSERGASVAEVDDEYENVIKNYFPNFLVSPYFTVLKMFL